MHHRKVKNTQAPKKLSHVKWLRSTLVFLVVFVNSSCAFAQHGQESDDLFSRIKIIDKSSEPTRASNILNKIFERRKLFEQGKTADGDQSGQASSTSNWIGVFELDKDDIDYSTLRFKPTFINPKHVHPDSDKYLIPSSQKIQQIYTSTPFGILIIDELKNAVLSLDHPNITIADEPATVAYYKHRDDSWVTIVYAITGTHPISVEADRKLEKDQSQSFIELIEDLANKAQLQMD